MTEIHAPHWPTTEDAWHRFVERLWGIRISREACCDEHTPPWLAFWRAFNAAEPSAIWHASRGFGGKSVLLAHLAMTEALVLGAGVTVLGGSGEQSQRVLEVMEAGWRRPGVTTYLASEPTKQRVKLRNGGAVAAITASTKSARGLHRPRLRLDETDEMDPMVYEASLGQPMEQPGRYGTVETSIVKSSTHHYPDGLMTRILREAATSGEPVYRWCYRCNLTSRGGWLTPQAVERKRETIPAHMWATEFELQEPSSDDRGFDSPAVGRAFDRDLGRFEGRAGERVIVERPVEGASYATGADWAKKKDWTIIATFRIDVEPWVCVAWERIGRMPWPQMIERFNRRLRDYGGHAAHDATGVGDVVADYLDDLDQRAEGVIMVGQKRAGMLTEYVGAIEDGAIRYPMNDFAYSEHLYCRVGDLYQSGKDFHLPDSVCAGALAWSLRAAKGHGFDVSAVSRNYNAETRDGEVPPWLMT